MGRLPTHRLLAPTARSPRGRGIATAALVLVGLLAASATAQDPEATPPARAVEWRTLRTPDGHRFLLVDTGGGPPLVHWARATFAGPGEDPAGMVGLAHACVRASFTDIGPPTETGTQQDPDAWRASLARAPASGPRLYESSDASVVSFAVPPVAAGELARLLQLRRQGARLLDAAPALTEVRRDAQRRRTDPLTLLRDELLGIIFFGTDRVPDGRPTDGASPEQAQVDAVWAATQRPGRGLDVIVGPVAVGSWTGLLQSEFAGTAPATLPEARPSNPRPGKRRSTLTGEALGPEIGVAVAIGFAWPLDAPNVDDRLGDWFAEWLGGTDGAVAQWLRSKQPEYRDVRVDVQPSFPGSRRPGLVLVEAWIPPLADGRTPRAGNLESDLFLALRGASHNGPGDDEFAAVRARREGAHARMLGDPARLAAELALQCGIGGRVPAEVFDPPNPTSAELADALRTLLGTGTRATVTAEEDR